LIAGTVRGIAHRKGRADTGCRNGPTRRQRHMDMAVLAHFKEPPQPSLVSCGLLGMVKDLKGGWLFAQQTGSSTKDA
jgi:hypothetical protein